MSGSSFNLSAPPGFRGMNPQLPVRIYHRHLPHWRQPGATYFVTFRLADSLPQVKIQALRRWRTLWEKQHPEPRSEEDWRELMREITNRTEAWLDDGYGDCVLALPNIAQLMQESLLKFQNERYTTSCYAIMPNHVHAIIRPLGEHTLENIVGSMKGGVSRISNILLGRKGALWHQETFDRIIRDEEHLFRVVQYIGRNPAKAGLHTSRWCRWIDSTWQQSGWMFEPL